MRQQRKFERVRVHAGIAREERCDDESRGKTNPYWSSTCKGQSGKGSGKATWSTTTRRETETETGVLQEEEKGKEPPEWSVRSGTVFLFFGEFDEKFEIKLKIFIFIFNFNNF